jgi:hypothetical protein
MSQLFKRNINIEISNSDGSEVITIPNDFKIAINIEKMISASSSEGTVTIWNLSDETKEAIRGEATSKTVNGVKTVVGQKIKVFAGYGNDSVLLHFGDVLRTTQVDEGADRKTIIYLGGNVYDTSNAVFSKSYNGSIKIRQIVSDAIPSLGLTFDSKVVNLIPDDLTIPNYSFSGKTSDALKNLLEPIDLQWLENNKNFFLSKKGEAESEEKENNVIVLSSNTGLIKTAVTTDRGINATCLLDPKLQPKVIVKIESDVETNSSFNTYFVKKQSKNTDGFYKITQVTYDGDNWDGKFEALIQCVPYDENSSGASA